MFKSPLLLEQARREGGEELALRIQDDDQHYKRVYLEDRLLFHWGMPFRTWPEADGMGSLSERQAREALPDLSIPNYAFSDQDAAFPILPSLSEAMKALFPWNNPYWNVPFWKRTSEGGASRIFLARICFREGTSVTQRFFMPLFFLFREIFELVRPFISLIQVLFVLFVRLLLLFGIRFPLLWWYYYTVSRSGIFGKEFLQPGENGYTRLFRGGEDVEIDDLEREFMTRNSDSSNPPMLQHDNIIAISYKHYANRGKVRGDDNRICRTDLQAIAMFIKAAAPCNVRFWIDAKLPPTKDGSFERWINRGVRPYGRYITLLCPSAMKYAESSFWLANEREFAIAGKGAMFITGDQIYYGFSSKFGTAIHLHRRLLLVIIGAEDGPVHVRDQHRGKVIHWAICCLRGFRGVVAETLSPCIDNLEMVGKHSHELILIRNISIVIRTFGPQKLPVIPGRCWNKQNPLLMGDVPDQEIELSNWFGLCRDGYPTTIYFVHQRTAVEIKLFSMVMVLEVTLGKPHFNPGKIRVTRKVLREMEISTLLECKLVTLPWLCDWE